MAVTRPTYASVSSMAKASELVALGRMGSLVTKREDNGGNPGTPGIPMAFYGFTVEKSLKGAEPASRDIVISWFDVDKVDAGVLPLPAAGRKVILYLDRLEASEVPGLADLAPLYSPVAGDAAVLEVDEAGLVTARVNELHGLFVEDESKPLQDEPFRSTVEQVSAASADS